jgi:circadian clock protein KaiC
MGNPFEKLGIMKQQPARQQQQQQQQRQGTMQAQGTPIRSETYASRTSAPLMPPIQPGRVATGIRGFDNLVQGGFKRGSVNLLSGGPGSGKTIFAVEFLVNGVTMFNEPVVYLSFDERKESIFESMLSFGWDLEKLSREGKFTFVEYSPEQLQKILNEGGGLLDNLMSKSQAKRFVIDSISTFLLMSQSEFTKREQLLSFFKLLKKWEVTTLLTNEYTPMTGNEISKESLSVNFETDSIIQLYNIHDDIGQERKRFLEVFKMRGTQHVTKAVPYEIDEKGVEILY